MTDTDPLVRVTVLGPDTTDTWHVFADTRGPNPDAGSRQAKLGTLTPAPVHGPDAVLATPTGQSEHPAPQSSVYAGARWLINQRTLWDLSLATREAWDQSAALDVDATIRGFDQRTGAL